MDDKLLETKLVLQAHGYDEYDIEEILDDYLPAVKQHIGFTDERSDKRFIVKFHDICFFTNTPEDMEQEDFDNLFATFCGIQYEWVMECLEEKYINEQGIFQTHDIGHYRAFEYIPENGITEDNVLDVTMDIYDKGLSPDYIHDYTYLVDRLQELEDNYLDWWVQFLKDEQEVNECITNTTIKNIERRIEEYKLKHSVNK